MNLLKVDTSGMKHIIDKFYNVLTTCYKTLVLLIYEVSEQADKHSLK